MREPQTKLDDWLTAARHDLAGRGPDPLAEQQLLARVREVRALQSIAAAQTGWLPNAHLEQRRKPTKARFWRRWSFRVPLALAAAVLIGIGVLTVAPVAPDGASTTRSPFIALVAPEAVAAERAAVVVASQVSGAALADYGLPVDPARVDQPVAAEFLLSPAGVVLGVRFTE